MPNYCNANSICCGIRVWLACFLTLLSSNCYAAVSWNPILPSNNGLWHSGFNWSTGTVPSSADHVLVGDAPTVNDGVASINENAEVATLSILNGMEVVKHAGTFEAVSGTTISGSYIRGDGSVSPSILTVHNDPLHIFDFVTSEIEINDSAFLVFHNSPQVTVNRLLIDPTSSFVGAGEVSFFGNTVLPALSVGGSFDVYGEMRLYQGGASRFDLDGPTGTGRISIQPLGNVPGRRDLNDEVEAVSPEETDDLLSLDEALSKLAAEDAQLAKLVELRYFVGLTIEETAEVLGVSPRTIKRNWAYARAWLQRAMSE